MYLLSFIGSPSSELFLALSGTVLLPVKTDFQKFYKRRFAKLIPPLVIWSVFGVLLLFSLGKMSWQTAGTALLHIPVQPAIGVYWFVYAMAGLYLLAPFISPWLKQASKKQIELFLGLWAINMLIPWVEFFIPGFMSSFSSNGNYYWTLCYFGGFLGYWLLGYYLNRHPIKLGMNWRCAFLFGTAILYPVIILFVKTRGMNADILVDNLQIGSAILVAMLYTVLQNVHIKAHIQKALSNIAKYSFGIYLTHIFIARQLYWGIFEGSRIHIFPRTFIIAFLTLLTGYAITRLLSKVPKGQWITGA